MANLGELTAEAWSDIVLYNSTAFKREQEEVKKKLFENKLKLKEELEKQVVEKKI